MSNSSTRSGLVFRIRNQCLLPFQIFSEILTLLADTWIALASQKRWRWPEIFSAIVHMGIESLPIIIIATAFAGLVVTEEIAWHLRAALGTVGMVPGFTGQFILRELGIAIPALLIVAKVGASITAEIGTMKVTEQIDALKLLKIDPIQYLVVPRFIAGIFSCICLTLIAVFVTMGCAMAMAVFKLGFGVPEYLNYVRHFLKLSDLFSACVKAAVYGGIIPVISARFGFSCAGGAEGVGTATTNSVVTSTIAVILLDFFLTFFFTSIF